MTITRLHMSITVLLVLALHGGIAMWLALLTPAPLTVPPRQALRVSVLATVAETSVTAAAVTPEPPVQQLPPVKPTSEPPPRMVKSVAKPVPPVEPLQEITPPTPMESSTMPLDTVATIDYEQLLVAWLEKHKKYPRRAKRLRIEGEGMLHIRIDRTGRTQRVILQQPTGNRLLDKAALEMVQRADPFPPIPQNDPRQELEFMVPVAFVLH